MAEAWMVYQHSKKPLSKKPGIIILIVYGKLKIWKLDVLKMAFDATWFLRFLFKGLFYMLGILLLLLLF
jgi:hypothetical protein